MIVSGKPLPVGEVYHPRQYSRQRLPSYTRVRHHRAERVSSSARVMKDLRSESLSGALGDTAQPFFVVRQVTYGQYCAWFEDEHGRGVTRADGLKPTRHYFYEISMD